MMNSGGGGIDGGAGNRLPTSYARCVFSPILLILFFVFVIDFSR